MSQFQIDMYISPAVQLVLKSDDHAKVDRARKEICATFNYEAQKKYGEKWTKHFRFVTWRQLVMTPLDRK